MNQQYIVFMAGVAGFEPTNDGVRGIEKLNKTYFYILFFRFQRKFIYSPLIVPKYNSEKIPKNREYKAEGALPLTPLYKITAF